MDFGENKPLDKTHNMGVVFYMGLSTTAQIQATNIFLSCTTNYCNYSTTKVVSYCSWCSDNFMLNNILHSTAWEKSIFGT